MFYALCAGSRLIFPAAPRMQRPALGTVLRASLGLSHCDPVRVGGTGTLMHSEEWKGRVQAQAVVTRTQGFVLYF